MDDLSKSVHDDNKGGVDVSLEDAQKTYDRLEYNYRKFKSALPEYHKNDNLDRDIVARFFYYAFVTQKAGNCISEKTDDTKLIKELNEYSKKIDTDIEDVWLRMNTSIK